jgi:hypothetical protein
VGSLPDGENVSRMDKKGSSRRNILDATSLPPLRSQSCTERRCRPADLEGDAAMSNYATTNSKRVSPELSLRLMSEQPNFELARFQRLIQHL